MRFTVAALERQAIDFEESLAPGSVDFIEDMRQVGVLHTAGHVDLLHENRGPGDIVTDIRIRGTLQTRMQLPCARCIEPVEEAIETEFDLLFRPLKADSEASDHSISTSETEIGYYEGDGLLLEDVLREQILLALPAKVLCREDCKGLCPECGRNRNPDINPELCDCVTHSADPRWSSLGEVRSRVKP
ncbi:MAG: DUF177 domain-containing protein [Acidobacteriaceae bacterium]